MLSGDQVLIRLAHKGAHTVQCKGVDDKSMRVSEGTSDLDKTIHKPALGTKHGL